MYRRALDQIEMSIAYPNQRVRMMGFLPGILTPGGVTHQAIDDIGVLKNLPNLTIIETGDATDIETMLPVIDAIDGPVYVRVLRKQVSRLFPANEAMQFNRVRVVSEGNDITLVTAGICTEEAMRVTELMRKKGVSIEHVHVNMHKPFSDPQVAKSIAKAKYGVITLENHTVISGLGAEVAETIALNGLNARLYRMGLQDTYSHGAGQSYLMKYHGIDAMALTKKIETILNQKFDIREEDLAAVRINLKASEGQLEAL
jgi:transketolase